MTPYLRRIAIFGLLLVACGIILACACEFASAQNVEGQIIASQYGQYKVPGEKTGTFLFPSDVCQVSGGGKNFSAFATGRAVKIVDSNPALTEVATPSSVFINQCSVNMATTYTHVPPYYLTSGTGGLQEAITANQTNNGVNSIILNWEWYLEIQPRSAATVIGSVTGITSLGLVDITTTPYQYYRWNGSQYVAIPTNGSVASVGLTAPGSVFGVTGSPVTVSGNLGLTLNAQAQNTALLAPCSGGSGAVGFRVPCAADIAQAGALYNAIASANINGMMYPAQCGSANPPSWCTGSTPDAWYRAACTQLPSAGGFINLLGLTGTIAASATCSSPSKQVITLADNTSRLNITEADGGIPFPQDNGSMMLGQGAGQCTSAGGIHLASGANVTAIVGPAHTDGTQEDFTAKGLCLQGASGATVGKGLLYSKETFVNTTISENNAIVCPTACLWLENVGGQVEVGGNEFDPTSGVFTVNGSGIVIAATGGAGCGNSSINIHGGNAEHANGGANYPEINILGNDEGSVACSVYVHDMYTERSTSDHGTPSTTAIKVRDCFGCSFSNIQAGGGSPVGSGDLINISQSAIGRTQNVTFNNINNILSQSTWLNALNDSTPGGKVLTSLGVPYIATYFSNPGYQQAPALPQSTIQSLTGDLMSGQGNLATGSGTFGTNFVAYGCVSGISCTFTRTNSTAPSGYTFSQEVQITANTDPVAGQAGIEFTPSISFTSGQTYQATFWMKGDGTYTGLPLFILGDPTVPTQYCLFEATNPLTTAWQLFTATCTPSTSGSSFLSFSTAVTPIGSTGTFWMAGMTFSPVNPLPATSTLLTSVGPYGLGPATNAQQTITLGTTALLLGTTDTTVAGLTLTGSFASTPSAGDNSTKIATTAYVQGSYAAPPAIGNTTPNAGTFSSVTISGGSPGLLTPSAFSVAGTPLPTCNGSTNVNAEAVVSDATTPTYLGAYVGSGTVHAPVFCDGVSWKTY